MNKCLYDIQEILEDELKKMCKQEALSSSDLEDAYRMVDIIKDISTIEAMENNSYGGYSGEYSEDYARRGGNSYGYPYSYEGQSNRGRSRDSMGRYSGRGSSYGYSGHGGKEEMIENLKESMMNARNDEERESFRRALEQLSR